jgi:hypothetical protein
MASVHSSARSYSARACQEQTTEQYTMADVIGSSSPVATATAASSKSANPSVT